MSPKLKPILAYLDALEDRADLKLLGAMLEGAKLTLDDVEEFLKFNDQHYSRNKVSSGTWYDLFVMGWQPGQCSCIHDHAGSSCALRIVQGTATEIGFEPVAEGSTYVHERGTTLYHSGTQCMAQDGDVHQIVNKSGEENLVTVHIYSPPLKMSVYKLEPEAAAV